MRPVVKKIEYFLDRKEKKPKNGLGGPDLGTRESRDGPSEADPPRLANQTRRMFTDRWGSEPYSRLKTP